MDKIFLIMLSVTFAISHENASEWNTSWKYTEDRDTNPH